MENVPDHFLILRNSRISRVIHKWILCITKQRAVHDDTDLPCNIVLPGAGTLPVPATLSPSSPLMSRQRK